MKLRAVTYDANHFDFFIPSCFSSLAFLGIVISVILFGFNVLSVDQTAKWILAMFSVFVVDQLFVKRFLKWLQSKKTRSHSE